MAKFVKGQKVCLADQVERIGEYKGFYRQQGVHIVKWIDAPPWDSEGRRLVALGEQTAHHEEQLRDAANPHQLPKPEALLEGEESEPTLDGESAPK